MSNVTGRQLPHSQNPAGWPTTTNAAQPTTQPWPTTRMPTVPPAAAEILRDAVWHIDAAEHQASGANAKTVRNLGWGGSVLNARCGSTTVADTNDPLFLPYNGTPYLSLPGIAGNSLTCTAPATATQYLATALDGTTASGAATGGATFTFSTAGSWATINLLDSGSAVVASFIGASLTSGSATAQTDTYAVAWTINRATTGRKSVAVVAPAWLFGTDDYMEVRTNLAIEMGPATFTVLVVRRQWDSNSGGILSRALSAGASYPGWVVRAAGASAAVFSVSNGTTSTDTSSGGYVSGAAQTLIAIRDSNSRQRIAGVGTVAVRTAETVGLNLDPLQVLTIGAYRTTNGPSALELMSAAIFRRALSTAEIATLTSYYARKYSQ